MLLPQTTLRLLFGVITCITNISRSIVNDLIFIHIFHGNFPVLWISSRKNHLIVVICNDRLVIKGIPLVLLKKKTISLSIQTVSICIQI